MTGVVVAALLATPTILGRGGLGMSSLAALAGISAVAAAQSRVLRRYRPALPTWGWIAAAIAGYVAAALAGILTLTVPALLGIVRTVAGPLGTSALPVVTTLVTGALLGAAMGFPPWVVLRRHFARAGVWILATAVASVPSALVPPFGAPATLLGLPLAILGARVAQGLLTAAATGAALVWLLRRGAAGRARLVPSASGPMAPSQAAQ